MPELPEVELARAAIECAGLHRRIAQIDDTDTWVCRPHAPGDIADALRGRRLTSVSRQGKTMWCETSGRGRSRTPGPVLGIHLGMSGRIVITRPGGRATEGGDRLAGPYANALDDPDRKSIWDRFTITFTDGGSLALFDKRRLGRVRLDPDLSHLGPDAQLVERAEFVRRVGRGTAPLKARLLDQSVLAGVGNLLADETLWQAKISPRRPADELSRTELNRLYRSLQNATNAAVEHGGVHTGEVIDFRKSGRHCPRCGTEMTHAAVGGRATWWCPKEQR